MKIALLADTHFGARNDSPAFSKYFFKFYDEVFFPYLKENNITTLIHLGDIVDRRKFINFKTSHDFRKNFMMRLWKEKIDTHIIIGNHDTYYKNTNQVNAVDELLTTYDGINEPHIYTNPKAVEFDGLRILMLPWICADNKDISLEALKQENADIVCGHLEIQGFEMHNGMRSQTGLSSKIFKRFETVYSGHFHHKSDDGHIHYLGSPYEFVWNDYKDQKGFHILDTETRELERIVNPFTMFEKIYYNDEKEKYDNFDYEPYKDKIIKVIVDKKTDYYMFDQFVDNFYKKINVTDIKVIEDFSDLDAATVADDIVEKSEDTVSLMNNYVEQLQTPLDKQRLKDFLRTLYTEAGDVEL